MALYKLHHGVYDSDLQRIIATEGERVSRKHPHGFIADQRVNGFWKGIRNNDIPHSFSSRHEHVHCDCCYDLIYSLKIEV